MLTPDSTLAAQSSADSDLTRLLQVELNPETWRPSLTYQVCKPKAVLNRRINDHCSGTLLTIVQRRFS